MKTDAQLSTILFLDIETVPSFDYEALSERQKELWDKKSMQWRKENSAEEAYEKASIYAEFGKIICISAGNIRHEKLTIKSFYGDNEKTVLQQFKESLEKFSKQKNARLCAHNGKEFDFPYLCRRMLINEISLPKVLCIQGKKPWEVPLLDTLDLWRFGDYKNYTSLDLLCEVFQIPTPKDTIDGAMVSRVYKEENGLEKIVKYCEKDVAALAQLYLKMNALPTISTENILFVE